jgi:hypothetical protein
MWGTYTELCAYENVCFEPLERVLTLFRDDVPAFAPGEEEAMTRRYRSGLRAWWSGGNQTDDLALGLAAYRRNKTYASHDDLLTGQVLPLETPPKIKTVLPMNSAMKFRFEAANPNNTAGRDSKISSYNVMSEWLRLRGVAETPEVAQELHEQTMLVLANKEQLTNIWYFASRVGPWFEARRLNASGMLPFPLPEPNVVYLQTTLARLDTDWHRSFLALAMDLPREVLFPDGYGESKKVYAAGRKVPRIIYRKPKEVAASRKRRLLATQADAGGSEPDEDELELEDGEPLQNQVTSESGDAAGVDLGAAASDKDELALSGTVSVGKTGLGSGDEGGPTKRVILRDSHQVGFPTDRSKLLSPTSTETSGPGAVPQFHWTEETRPRCFARAIVSGASGFVFGDTLSASEFRATALESVGRASQLRFVGPGKQPYSSSVLNLHFQPRSIQVCQDLLAGPKRFFHLERCC